MTQEAGSNVLTAPETSDHSTIWLQVVCVIAGNSVMALIRFLVVLGNTFLFVVILFSSVRSWRREILPGVRRLWLVVWLIATAIVLGSSYRLVLLAGELGWLSTQATWLTTHGWQLAQSLVVAGLGGLAFVSVRRIALSIGGAERLMHQMLERVTQVDFDRLALSPRESEVMTLMGSGLVTDAELADALHISVSTVQTHVKSLLRKTGLHRRQDLMFAAALVPSSVVERVGSSN